MVVLVCSCIASFVPSNIVTVLADQFRYFRQPSFEVQGFSVYGSVLLKEGVSGAIWGLTNKSLLHLFGSQFRVQ